MRDWWLDERSHAGPEHLDAAYVSGYERKAGYDPADDIATLRRFGLGPGSTVVDLGAGTGVFALAAARVCARVVAVDVSPAMLAVLRQRVEESGAENVTVVESGVLEYQHEGEPPDVVFSRNALHHLPDFWKAIALTKIGALLPPGGVLGLHDLVYDFEPVESSERIDAWLRGAVGDPQLGYTAHELAQHVRDEYSTFTWLFDALLDHAGFDVVERSTRAGAYASYTCARRAMPAL
jgi:cyclopropane fatty-acyl-phospholipid synthase-like methyltransferase